MNKSFNYKGEGILQGRDKTWVKSIETELTSQRKKITFLKKL